MVDEIKVTQTKTGQFRVTIPVQLARLLDLKQGSRLKAKIQNKQLVFNPA